MIFFSKSLTESLNNISENKAGSINASSLVLRTTKFILYNKRNVSNFGEL